jgi:hypothetical protein
MYHRACNDDGVAAPVVRTGGGVKYFLTRKIGIGLSTNLTIGPGFHSSSNVNEPRCPANSYVDFYGAWDVLVGGEFLL